MGYTVSTLQKLVEFGAKVHVVCWDYGKITPYSIPDSLDICFYQRSQMTQEKILNITEKIDPDLVVVSGWQDRMYLDLCKIFIKKGLPVVCGFDDQWKGSLKQQIASILSKMGLFSIWFTHAWVSGPRQFEYARRLGFSKNKILFDLYSADLNIFSEAYSNSKLQKNKIYPHNFIFVGRFETVKGIDTLAETWHRLGASRQDWTLTMVGNGSLKKKIRRYARN